LAISTATAGLFLLLIVLLIGADHERSIELRATRYGGWSAEMAHDRSGQISSDTTTGQGDVDSLRWIRVTAFSVTAISLIAIAVCVLHRRKIPLSRGVENWPRPVCALPHRQHADQWQSVRAALGANIAELLGNRLTVRQVMTTTAPLASPKTSIRALKSMLAARPLMPVAICNSSGMLLGIVSEADLRRRGHCAADIMTRDPYTAPPGARLDAAVTLMLDNQVHCLPIVEDGMLRGMLTADDLMVALDCLLQAMRDLATTGVSHGADTQIVSNQGTKRFPPTSTRQGESPDTMTAPAVN
jgi:CBS domain-containing protein